MRMASRRMPSKMRPSRTAVKYFVRSSEIGFAHATFARAPNHPFAERTMPEQKAHEVLRKHNISLEDVKERRATLHHLRHIVHAEELPFDVFKAIVKLRR